MSDLSAKVERESSSESIDVNPEPTLEAKANVMDMNAVSSYFENLDISNSANQEESLSAKAKLLVQELSNSVRTSVTSRNTIDKSLISKENVQLIMEQFEIEKSKAEAALAANLGDIKTTIFLARLDYYSKIKMRPKSTFIDFINKNNHVPNSVLDFAFNSLFRKEILNFKSPAYSSIFSPGILENSDGEESLTTSPPFSSTWLNCQEDNMFAFGNEEGIISIVSDVDNHSICEHCHGCTGGVFPRSGWIAHNNAIFDLASSSDGQWLVSASADSTCKIWDVETGKEYRCLLGHSGTVKSVAFDPMRPDILVTGGRDNVINVWDMRFSNKVGKNGEVLSAPVTSISNVHGDPVKKKKNRGQMISATVTSSLFLSSSSTIIASCGTSDSSIKYWDIRSSTKKPIISQQPTLSGSKKFGYNCLKLNPAGNMIYASCMNDHIYGFNALTLTQTNDFYSPSTYDSNSFYIKIDISHCGEFIASGSKDSDVYIWHTQNENNHAILKAHRAEVTSVSWAKKSHKLVTCSDDMTVKVWKRGETKSELDPRTGLAERVFVEKKLPKVAVISTLKEEKENDHQSNQGTPNSNNKRIEAMSGLSSSSNSSKRLRSTSITQFFKPLPK